MEQRLPQAAPRRGHAHCAARALLLESVARRPRRRPRRDRSASATYISSGLHGRRCTSARAVAALRGSFCPPRPPGLPPLGASPGRALVFILGAGAQPMLTQRACPALYPASGPLRLSASRKVPRGLRRLLSTQGRGSPPASKSLLRRDEAPGGVWRWRTPATPSPTSPAPVYHLEGICVPPATREFQETRARGVSPAVRLALQVAERGRLRWRLRACAAAAMPGGAWDLEGPRKLSSSPARDGTRLAFDLVQAGAR
jgi:hypothetical protein